LASIINGIEKKQWNQGMRWAILGSFSEYNEDFEMKRASLTDEQREALACEPDGIEVEDPDTHKIYVLADADLHRRAMRALTDQEDREAIQAGIEDMEAGRVVSFEDVDRRIRAKLEQQQSN
jgi:predicted transcriptional regulator